jgi:hypothetical protein
MDENKPSGDSIRDIINPALNDERGRARQLEILDDIFSDMAAALPQTVSGNLRKIFNQISRLPEDQKNIRVMELMTEVDPMSGAPRYSPVIPQRLPLSTAFTDFSTEDIRNLPGYIKLHMAAREENVALRLLYITADETKAQRGLGPGPVLVIDASKSYEEGAVENGYLYPNLPPKASEVRETSRFRKTGGDIKFD